MKGAVLRETGGPGSLRVEDVDEPDTPDEAVVRVSAAALNRRDLFITYGQYPGIELPAIMGSDGAGRVERLPVGYGGDLAVGDDVVILPSFDWGDDPRQQSPAFTTLGVPRDGTFAEYVSVPVDHVYRMPPHLGHDETAALPLAGVTAYRALTSRGRLQPGETVLIPGAGGGVAGLAVQFAAALGARVFVTSGREENLELARRLGAVDGVNSGDDDWAKRLKNLAGPVDLVVDTIGGGLFSSLLRVLRAGGRVVTLGASAGPVPELVLPHVFLKQIDVRGTSMGNATEFEGMLRLVADAHIRPLVGSRFPLTEISAAMRKMETGQATGKIIIVP